MNLLNCKPSALKITLLVNISIYSFAVFSPLKYEINFCEGFILPCTKFLVSIETTLTRYCFKDTKTFSFLENI